MPAPNIVFIFSDQQHWQAAGVEDPSFTTPNLDALATRAVVFERSFCTCPQCSPSRSSILTGRYPHRTGVLGNIGAAGGEPLRMETVAPRLQRAGYRTAYFGKWHLGKDPVATGGWDEDFGVTGPETTDDAEVTRRALDFLQRRGNEGPFALFLSYNNPHDIYQFTAGTRVDPASTPLHADHDRDDLSSKPGVQRQFMHDDQGAVMTGAEADDWRAYRALYREMVRRYDACVGEVLAAMDRLGLFEDTLLVVTSDHGDMDGVHGLVYKGPFMYEQMMRVPLLIRLPSRLGGPQARRLSPMVVNTDLVPTLLDVAGAEPLDGDGTSLLPVLTGTGDGPSRAFVVGQYYSKQRWVNPIRMLRTDRWKLTRYATGDMELYDLNSDPGEIVNLAGYADHAAVVADLNARLDAWIRDNADPFPTQRPTTREGKAVAS